MEKTLNFEDADFNLVLEEFLNHYLKDEQIELYNEISFQLELGLFLRKKFPNDKIEFERNIKKLGITYQKSNPLEESLKKEMDIYIYNKKNKSKKFAIELKFPMNGKTPEEMYQFVLDIKFMQVLKDANFTKTYAVVATMDKTYHTGSHHGRKDKNYIFKYFRHFPNQKEALTGKIYKPTGKDKHKKYIDLGTKIYEIKWKNWDISNQKNSKYYVVSIDK